jgi:hypothetical protein
MGLTRALASCSSRCRRMRCGRRRNSTAGSWRAGSSRCGGAGGFGGRMHVLQLWKWCGGRVCLTSSSSAAQHQQHWQHGPILPPTRLPTCRLRAQTNVRPWRSVRSANRMPQQPLSSRTTRSSSRTRQPTELRLQRSGRLQPRSRAPLPGRHVCRVRLRRQQTPSTGGCVRWRWEA